MHRLIRALALGLALALCAAPATLLPASPAIAAFANIVKFTATSSGTSDFSDGTAPTGFLNLSAGAVSGQDYSYRAYSADLSQWEDGRGTYTSGSPGTLSRTTIYESSTGSKISFSTAPVVILTPLKADMDAFGSVTSASIAAGTGISTSGTCTITTSGTCTVGLSTPVSVANGGTGSTSLAANNVLLGNGTSALQTVAPGTSGNVLTSDGTTWKSSAPTTPGLAYLTSGSVSSQSSLDINLSSYTAYRGFRIVLSNLVVSTAGSNLEIRTSTNSGSTFDSGSTDYAYAYTTTGSSYTVARTAGAAFIQVADTIATTAGDGQGMATIDMFGQTGGATQATILFQTLIWNNNSSIGIASQGGGKRRSTTAVNAIRFLMSSGNLSVDYAVYGYN